MEETKNLPTDKDLILAGICPKNHQSEDKVCRGCYEDLLRKFTALKNNNGKSKSQWQTW